MPVLIQAVFTKSDLDEKPPFKYLDLSHLFFEYLIQFENLGNYTAYQFNRMLRNHKTDKILIQITFTVFSPKTNLLKLRNIIKYKENTGKINES